MRIGPMYLHCKRNAPVTWYYVSIFGWQPFAFLNHSGWMTFNASWFKRFAFDIPKQRGWRWD